MNRKQEETKFYNNIKVFLDKNGHRCVKLGTVGRNVTQNRGKRFYSLGTRNVPDILVFMIGISFLVELKIENNTPSNGQIKFAAEILKNQGVKSFFLRHTTQELYEVWDVMHYDRRILETLMATNDIKERERIPTILTVPTMKFTSLEDAMLFMYVETLERTKKAVTIKEKVA